MADLDDIYRRYGPMVERRAQQILGSRDDAAEVLHELFLSLLERPGQLHRARSVRAWLYGATTHACLNRLRDKKSRLRLLEAHAEAQPDRRDEASERLRALAAARQILRQLPDDLAEVAVYYWFDEMTHAEIAEVVGCSRRQVGNLLERAEQRIERIRNRERGIR